MPPPRNRRVISAVAFATGPVLYLTAEAITAAAWTRPPYSYLTNWISDLGSTVTGTFQGRLINSPLYDVMNAGFILQGITFTIATLLFGQTFAPRLQWTTRILGVSVGIGFVLLGVFHGSQVAAENGTLVLHFTGAALSLIGANTLAVILGIYWTRHDRTAAGWTSTILGVIGLVAIVALFATFGSTAPAGAIERASAYPVMIWQLLIATQLTQNGTPRR